MGCISSSSNEGESNDLPTQTRFVVKNVDDQNRIVNEGEIEITDIELILHSSTAEPVKWPLRFLRRYGFDDTLFSFESGRRCPTGEGIYAFSTKQAKAIFTLVEHNVRFGPKSGPGIDEPAESSMQNGTGNGQSPNAQRREDHSPGSPNGAEAAQPVNLPDSHPKRVQEKSQITYIQVDLANPSDGAPQPVKSQNQVMYSDVILLTDGGPTPAAADSAAAAPSSMNYIQVNFDNNKTNGKPAAGPEQAKQRTPYTDVIVDPRRPSTGNANNGPTLYTPIDQHLTQGIKLAKMDA